MPHTNYLCKTYIFPLFSSSSSPSLFFFSSSFRLFPSSLLHLSSSSFPFLLLLSTIAFFYSLFHLPSPSFPFLLLSYSSSSSPRFLPLPPYHSINSLKTLKKIYQSYSPRPPPKKLTQRFVNTFV